MDVILFYLTCFALFLTFLKIEEKNARKLILFIIGIIILGLTSFCLGVDFGYIR